MMRRTIITFIKLVSVIFLIQFGNNSMAQRFSSPLDYMNYISEQYQTINEDLWNYVKAASHSRNAGKVEAKRKELLGTMNLAKLHIKKLPGYEGDFALRDSTVAYLDMSYLVLKEDFGKIVDMEAIAEQSYDLMEAYMMAKKLANEKLNLAAEIVRNEQKIFAEHFGITLLESENKIEQKLKVAGKVYDYYDVVYLAFFKSYKQEIYYLNALSQKDLSGMEQSRKALINYSNEGKKILDSLRSFNGDYSLSQQCRVALEFFINEAEKEFLFFSDFLLKDENLKSMQKAIENKSPSKRTKEETEAYNKSINEFNSLVKDYNTKGELLNKERSKIYDGWENAATRFVDKHVP